MDDFSDLLAANRDFAASADLGGFDGIAKSGVAIVTCMDSRIDPLRLVGLKPGDPDTLIRFAFTAAERYGAKLQVVRAWSPHDALYPLEPARAPEHVVTASVEDLLRPLEPYFPGVETQITAARAHPVTSLVEASRGARLVIVGRRHRGPLSVGAGTVVDNLLEHSHAPVAIVPPPE